GIRWQLPDGVSELLPAEAWRLELLRRSIMDNSFCWGYQLVMPPLIEYLDSLLTGTGEMLNLQTFKIVDQHNGRTLGIRADITPQVARMDAHALRSDLPNRFFYIGTVLRTRTDGAGSSRNPLQFGAELFGHSGMESDVEVIQLMLENVMQSGLGIDNLLLDLGHVGVFRSLIAHACLADDVEKLLFDAVIRGSQPEIWQLLDGSGCDCALKDQITGLMGLSGEYKYTLERAREHFREADPSVQLVLENLQSIIDSVTRFFPGLDVNIDLSDLRGYRYHTGTIFTLYDTEGVALASGGRYDAIGEEFGHGRSATGFSGDLLTLSRVCTSGSDNAAASGGIWVEACESVEQWQQVQSLRKRGERVLVGLKGSTMRGQDCHCDRKLVQEKGKWRIVPLGN
ncbi:MAG: ATP phosphoribosyltransferase regulatory subunit, partial [Granulosicoccus sp.]